MQFPNNSRLDKFKARILVYQNMIIRSSNIKYDVSNQIKN